MFLGVITKLDYFWGHLFVFCYLFLWLKYRLTDCMLKFLFFFFFFLGGGGGGGGGMCDMPGVFVGV